MDLPSIGLPNLANEETQRAIRRARRRLVPFLLLMYILSFLDRANIGFAKQAFQASVGISDAAYALGAGLFFITYAVLEVPSNLMLYKVGARRWIARIMISWGLTTAAVVFVCNEWQFYGLRFLLGVMEAGFAPGVLYYLTLWFPPSYRGRITSMLFLASAFSGLVGAPLAGLANKIRERVPVPLVDGIQAAVVMAEGLVRMNPRKATAGTYRRPAAKDSKGLSAALADVIGHRGP